VEVFFVGAFWDCGASQRAGAEEVSRKPRRRTSGSTKKRDGREVRIGNIVRVREEIATEVCRKSFPRGNRPGQVRVKIMWMRSFLPARPGLRMTAKPGPGMLA